MRRDSPVLVIVVLLWEVFLVIGEEGIQLDALLEVFNGFLASDLSQEVEVSEEINARPDKSVPVDALDLDVGGVLLELEAERLDEVDVGALDRVQVCPRHVELVEVVVLGEDLHLLSFNY